MMSIHDSGRPDSQSAKGPHRPRRTKEGVMDEIVESRGQRQVFRDRAPLAVRAQDVHQAISNRRAASPSASRT
jgi:hypothetical protein